MTPKAIKFFRRCLKVTLWSAAASAFAVAALLVLILDSKPKYLNTVELSSSNLKLASSLLKRVSKTIINTRKTVTLQASQDELNSALSFINHSYKRVSGVVNIVDNTATFAVSIRSALFGKAIYLNAQASLLNSNDGLHWTQAKISSTRLSDGVSNFLFEKLIHLLLGKAYGESIISGIDGVLINNKALEITFSPPSNLQKGFAKAIQRISAYSGQSLNFKPERVQHYLAFLVDLTRALPQQNVSAAVYLRLLMQEAKQETRNNNLAASSENLAAIYALAILVAPGVFRHFVDDLKVNRLNATYQPKLTLNTRHDLAKHFVFSAALHILAEKGMSFSLGEAKEIFDSDKGGSGFSFADISADLSGIRFAQLAIADDESAGLIQTFCSLSLRESDFFPAIHNLPEGLSKTAFLQQFGDIHSEKYKRLIFAIESRIAATPLLKRG